MSHAISCSVQTDYLGAEIQPTMWGIFFEDINFAADGGLYAELVKNRSFRFDDPLMTWSVSGSSDKRKVEVIHLEGNHRAIRIDLNNSLLAMVNEGFDGMGIKIDVDYRFTMQLRLVGGSMSSKVELITENEEVLASRDLDLLLPDRSEYECTLIPARTEANARLRIWFEGKGRVDVGFVSLFPSDTWKGRLPGLRADLVQLLFDLKPGFLRFPGGCIVEGRNLDQRYRWKSTIGDFHQREVLINRWNTEFADRLAPDYYQSFGIGFYEYFVLAEDIGASPLPIINCGMACQFNTCELVPLDALGSFVQDALDLIEFANGTATSQWGSIRAQLGHPEPFNLTMIGIGNEQWGPEYFERYKVFAVAIKERYPEIKLVSASGPYPDGQLFEQGWHALKMLHADIIDEHYYREPQWFLQQASRYDHYNRSGPRVLAGEYAAQTSGVTRPDNKNNWECALSEAAFMTGLERNADIVHLSSYAPLFGHVRRWQWTPNLIWFDSLSAFGTPSYLIQKMFSTHKGTHTLNITSSSNVLAGESGVYASAVWDEKANEIIIKVVNANPFSVEFDCELIGLKVAASVAMNFLSASLSDMNSLEDPDCVCSRNGEAQIKENRVMAKLQVFSFSVLCVKT